MDEYGDGGGFESFDDGGIDSFDSGSLDSFDDGGFDSFDDGGLDSFDDAGLDTLDDGGLDSFDDGSLDSFDDASLDTLDDGSLGLDDGGMDSFDDAGLDTLDDGSLGLDDGGLDSFDDAGLDTLDDGSLDTIDDSGLDDLDDSSLDTLDDGTLEEGGIESDFEFEEPALDTVPNNIEEEIDTLDNMEANPEDSMTLEGEENLSYFEENGFENTDTIEEPEVEEIPEDNFEMEEIPEDSFEEEVPEEGFDEVETEPEMAEEQPEEAFEEVAEDSFEEEVSEESFDEVEAEPEMAEEQPEEAFEEVAEDSFEEEVPEEGFDEVETEPEMAEEQPEEGVEEVVEDSFEEEISEDSFDTEEIPEDSLETENVEMSEGPDGVDEISDSDKSPMDEMTEYLSEHNYSMADYAEYSKDPEWQELNNKILEADGREPIDYSNTETIGEMDEVIDHDTAMNDMTEYLSEHNYGAKDYNEYKNDPEWQELNNRILESEGREPIDYSDPETTSKIEYPGDTAEAAMSDMNEYLSEHNYGKEDYAEYSKDPEWQELNNRILYSEGKEPIDYSADASNIIDNFDEIESSESPAESSIEDYDFETSPEVQDDYNPETSGEFVHAHNPYEERWDEFAKEYEDESEADWDSLKDVPFAGETSENTETPEDSEVPENFEKIENEEIPDNIEISEIQDVSETPENTVELSNDTDIDSYAVLRPLDNAYKIENAEDYEHPLKNPENVNRFELYEYSQEYENGLDSFSKDNHMDSNSKICDLEMENGLKLEDFTKADFESLKETNPMAANKLMTEYIDRNTSPIDINSIEPTENGREIELTDGIIAVTDQEVSREFANIKDFSDGKEYTVYPNPLSRQPGFDITQGQNSMGLEQDCGLASSSEAINGILEKRIVSENSNVELANKIQNFEYEYKPQLDKDGNIMRDEYGEVITTDEIDWANSGGTVEKNIGRIFDAYNIKSDIYEGDNVPSSNKMAEALKSGDQIVAAVNSDLFWNEGDPREIPGFFDNMEQDQINEWKAGVCKADHYVNVYAACYDKTTGELTGFMVKDTGAGRNEMVSLDRFERAFNGDKTFDVGAQGCVIGHKGGK